MEIIAISKQNINGADTDSVSARELHKKLEIKKPFTDWIKVQISRAGLVKNTDYLVFHQKVINPKSSGGRPTYEYILTIESAKHIAMMSQSKRGKEIRDYFIEVEKRYHLREKNSSDDVAVLLKGIVPSMELIAQTVASLAQSQESILELLRRERPQKIVNNTLNLSQNLTKESEEVFIEAVLNILKSHPRGINQTLLLRYLGRMKSDKTATRILHANVGQYWNAIRGEFNSIVYSPI